MPFLIFIFAALATIALRLGFLLLATWVFILSLTEVLADIDHFWGWFGIFVALGVVFAGSTAKVNTN